MSSCLLQRKMSNSQKSYHQLQPLVSDKENFCLVCADIFYISEVIDNFFPLVCCFINSIFVLPLPFYSCHSRRLISTMCTISLKLKTYILTQHLPETNTKQIKEHQMIVNKAFKKIKQQSKYCSSYIEIKDTVKTIK